MRKSRKDGLRAAIEMVWSYAFRHTIIGLTARSVFGDIFVEKLVMAPKVGYWPHIRDPRSFNEKIMHRKWCTADHQLTTLSDKVAVREFVSDRVGDDVLNDIYYIADDPDTIPFSSLPAEYVIKSSHGSGHVIIVDDNEGIDKNLIRKECSDWLAEPYGVAEGQYWQADIDRKIIIEERLFAEEHDVPFDYKFFVFHGSVEYIQMDMNRFNNHTKRFYDRDWNALNFTHNYPLGPAVDRPKKLEKIVDIDETLASGFDFLRVDLYCLNDDRIVFGEITAAPAGGGGKFDPKRYDFKMGSYWNVGSHDC